jgi:hypothetical protein
MTARGQSGWGLPDYDNVAITVGYGADVFCAPVPAITCNCIFAGKATKKYLSKEE